MNAAGQDVGIQLFIVDSINNNTFIAGNRVCTLNHTPLARGMFQDFRCSAIRNKQLDFFGVFPSPAICVGDVSFRPCMGTLKFTFMNELTN